MKNIFKTIRIFLLVTGYSLLVAAPALAADLVLTNPLGQISGPGELWGRLLANALIPALGVSALAMFVYGGWQMVISQGNEEKAKKGQQTMYWAALGLIVAFVSYIVLSYFFTALTESVV